MIDARVANPPVCVRIVDRSVAMRTQREEVHTVAERVYGRLTVAPDADTAWGRVEGGALLAEGREYILPHWNGGAAVEGALEAMQALTAWGFSRERRIVALRGAAIAAQGYCVVLLGAPGAGRTTLVLAAAEAGWQVLADDCVVIDPSTGLVHAYPRLPLIRTSSLPLLSTTSYRLRALEAALRLAWTAHDGAMHCAVDLDRLFERPVWGRHARVSAIVRLRGDYDDAMQGAMRGTELARFVLSGASGGERTLQGLTLVRRWPYVELRRADPPSMLIQLAQLAAPVRARGA